MVVDAVRSYFDAASGLTELTRKRAVAAAKTLLKAVDDRAAGAPGPSDRAEPPAGEDDGGTQRSPRVGHDIQSLASELIETNQANRAALSAMVEAEVTRVLDRLDLVRRDEYERVVRRVAELERRLATQRVPAARVAQTAGTPADATPPADAPAPPAETSTGEQSEAREEPNEAPATSATTSTEAASEEPEETNTGSGGGGGTAVPPDETVAAESDSTAKADDREDAPVAESVAERATTADPDSGSEGDAEDSGGEAGDTTERQTPDTAQRSGSGGNKGTKDPGKQSASNTAGKSGRSKSATKRSGGRARNTAQAKKNEQ